MVWILYAGLSLVFCWPLFEHPLALGAMDWDQHLFYYGSFLRNVVDYRQLPFWNPWYCGGQVMWQNPQIPILSPAYLMTLVMPLQLAMKVNVLLHYFIGFAGMHVLLTEVAGLTMTPLIVFFASAFTLQGAVALHLGVGHSVFLPVFYLPWQLYFFFSSVRHRSIRDALAGGIVMALMIYNGGLHAIPMGVATIGVASMLAAATERDWRPVAFALLLGVAGAAYAAPKLLPVVSFVASDQFWDTRPAIEHPDEMPADMMLRAFLDPYQGRRLVFSPSQRHPWHEYGNYVGGLAAVVVSAAMLWAFAFDRSRVRSLHLTLGITALVLLILSAGEFASWAPGQIVTHLPLFSQFRIPSRFTIPFVLVGVTLAGSAVRALAADRTLSRPAALFIASVCLFATADLVRINRTQFGGVFAIDPPGGGMLRLHAAPTLETETASTPYTSDSPMFRSLMTGYSVFNCYESLQLRHSSDAEHPLVFSDGLSQVTRITFTPNRIEFSVVGGSGRSRVFLNQNYADGWSSSAGPVERDTASGRPSVVVGPGQTGRFAFTFRPPGLLSGTVLFLLAVGISAYFVRRRA